MNTGLRRARNVLVPLLLALATLWAAYLWLYHGWVAGGPPSPNPEWHRAWSVRFARGMLGSFSLLILWLLRHRLARWRRTAPPPDSLAAQMGRTVELRFRDGEVVHARLLAIDPDDHEDVTYEVVRIVALGSPSARGTRVGAIVVAPLHELEEYWRLVE